ncbi:MAG: hypothetical protein DRJ68_01125 [Thermoprotei archaeon]|nr:MAG: hypothetical protein DRJ68_01125 [Thermoprotei archaeon]
MPHRVRTPASIAYVVAIIAGAVAYLSLKGVGISLRYLSAAFPWIRSTDPLVVSVAEHSMTTWSHFFLQFGFILVLGVAGLYFLVQRLNDVDVLFVLLGLLTAYVATNMVRLNLLLAPVFSLLAGVACSRVTGQLLKHFSLSKQEGRKRALKIPRSHVVLGLFAVLIVLTPAVTGFSTIDPRTGLPTNLAYADSPILMSRDWLSALEWMRENLPEDAVVASWWDHGYWIAIVGNRTSVCDNSTFNGTQIRLIARAFLSNETEALKIFKQLGVTHVVVHGIFYDLGSRILGIPMWISWGHDYVAISYSAMASIAGFNVDDYIELDNFGLLSQWVPVPRGPKAAETTLYRLIYNPVGNRFLFLKELNVTVTEEGYLRIMGYELLNIPPPEHFKLVYASEPNQYVMIYEVLYED